MNNTEKTVAKLEQEIQGLKNAFEQTAFQLPVFTKTVSFRTSKNNITITEPGVTPFTFEGAGRTVVTFTSAAGVNTLAVLEIDFNDGGLGLSNVKFRRVPYSGGARWIIYDDGGENEYTFVVHSAVDGVLGAKMIWQ